MRLTSTLLRRVGEWSKKYSNLPDSYIERAMAQVHTIISNCLWKAEHVFVMYNTTLFTINRIYNSSHISYFPSNFNIINEITIRFIGERLINQIICHAPLKGNNFVSLYIVHGLISFIVTIGLVRDITSFTSSLLRIGVSLEAIGYVNMFGKL